MKTSVSLNPKNSVSAFGNSYCHIKRIDLEIVIGSGNMWLRYDKENKVDLFINKILLFLHCTILKM